MRCLISHVFLLWAIVMSATATAAMPIYDDFEDGSATDGQPLTWGLGTAPFDNGVREVVNGDYLLTPDLDVNIPGLADYRENDSNVVGLILQDVSMETTARALGNENDYVIGLYGRDTWDGALGITIWSALTRDGTLILTSTKDSNNTRQRRQATGLDAYNEDVRLRLDILGDTATAYAWPAGDPTPDQPLLTLKLPGPGAEDYMVEGGLGIWNGQFGIGQSETIVPIAFRDFRVVPEPHTCTLLLIAMLVLGARRRRRLNGTTGCSV